MRSGMVADKCGHTGLSWSPSNEMDHSTAELKLEAASGKGKKWCRVSSST